MPGLDSIAPALGPGAQVDAAAGKTPPYIVQLHQGYQGCVLSGGAGSHLQHQSRIAEEG
ncbi:MAG: hypothetical protein V8T45_05310 [Oscillospiraceae bacterium]